MTPDPHTLMTPDIRFLVDNLLDGLKDESLLVWYALDTFSNEKVWVLGRRIKDRVMPCAILGNSSRELVERYAPARGLDDFDLSRIIIKS